MKVIRIICAVLTSAVIVSSFGAVTSCADWEESEGKTKYIDDNGEYVTGWQKIDGKKYYFDSKGIMKKGWLKTKSGKYYYFKKDGSMATGTLKLNGVEYKFDSNGVWDGNGKTPLQEKTVDREALKAEFYELKDKRDEAYEKLKKCDELYQEALEHKKSCLEYVDYYQSLADSYAGSTRLIYSSSGNQTYSKTKSKYYDLYMGYAKEYKDLANDWDKEMNKITKYKGEWTEVYRNSKDRMAEIKKILENK